MVTGSTGFIGRSVVEACLASGHSVVSVSRGKQGLGLAGDLEHVSCDIANLRELGDLPDVDSVVHLAWPGLRERGYTNKQENQSTYLPESLEFAKAMFAKGVGHVVMAGTCFEYGQKIGGMRSEDDEPQPDNNYSEAKNQLRVDLEKSVPDGACMQWARIFYAYGPGQGPNNLLPQLEAAVSRGDESFPMSPGQHARDFVHVKDLARMFVALLANPGKPGIFNLCSGKPTKVIDLVRERLSELGASIELDTSAYPAPVGEADAWWGNDMKIKALL